MNKKTKNIVSVLQSMSAAVLCTLCTVLFLASCTDDSLVDNPYAQNAFRTVSVDLGMPQGKPAYVDGTDSRAQMADTTATGYRLSFDTAETGKPDASRAGSNNWIDGDKLLLHIVASNADPNSQTTEGMLTLTYSDSKWSLDEVNSYTKYGASFVAYNSTQPKLLITDDDTNINLANLKMQVDEKIGMSANVTATLFYAPHMKWSLTEGSVTLVVDETASTYEKWEWTNTNSSWTTPYARLRVNTGNGNAGDVVTLTSSAFDSAWEVEPTEGEGENAKTVYTATTDAEGNAYFYGITNGTLTDNFLVELTQMRVPVPTAAPASEGRSITLVDESTLLIDLDEPITLLEASDVVPVTLTATHAYKLTANDKRDAAMTENINSLSVIDGQCGITEVTVGLYVGTDDHVAAVKMQIETAVAMGVTDFTVVNQLAVYNQFVEGTNAFTVVGEAIRRIGAANSNARISLTLSDATMVINAAFYQCTALQSVSASVAEDIGPLAFYQCTALQSVSASVAEDIGPLAFYQCIALQSVLAPAVTAIGDSAFDGCSSLQSVSLGNVTTISSYAFQNTQVTNLNFDYLTVLGSDALSGLTFSNLEIAKEAASDAYIDLHQKAFRGCTLTGSVTFHKVVYESGNYDGLTQENAFEGVATSELDLFLHAEQPIDQISVSNDGKLKWAGAEWASITLLDGPNGTAGTKYYIDNGMPTVEVDGTIGGKTSIVADDVTAMNSKIKVVADAAATTNVSAKVIVKNELAAYTNENATQYDIYAGTVVGEAIRLLTPSEESRSAETVNYNGRITLTLDNATELPQIAFAHCNALQNVSAPNATEIGLGAFNSCTALTSVSLPVATTIGVYAFQGCIALTNVNLDKVTQIVSYAFSDVPLADLEIGANAATDITLGEQAFTGSTITGYVKFHKVVTGEGLTNKNAFSEVTTSGLDLYLAAEQPAEQITVENGQLMWAGAAWKSITVGDKVYTQETGFVKLTIGGTETYAVIDGMYGNYTGEDGTEDQFNAYRYNVKTQIAAAYTAEIKSFYVINELGTYKYTITENVGGGYYEQHTFQVTSSVVSEAFTAYANENTSARVSITLADATTVPESAFYGCTALSDINWDKVASIGDDAFRNCTALTSVTTAATQIGNSAFNGCTNLQSATFTSTDTEIEDWAFSGCTNLTTVSWDKVKSIGDYAFSECKALVNVSSSTVTTVGNFAFRNCTFKTVSLPEVTTLGNGVFKNCTSLKQLTLGNVTSVDLGQYTHSFKEFNTEDCDLTLGAGQEGFSNDNISNGIWAGMQWKSITVGGEQKYSSANAPS